MKRRYFSSLVIGAAVAVVLLAANVFLTFRNTRQLNEDASWVTHTHEVISGLANILSLAKDAETGQRGFIITGEPRYLEPYTAALASLDTEVDRVQKLTADNPRQQAKFPELQKHLDGGLKLLAANIELRKEGGLEAARQAILTDQGKREMDALREVVGGMIQQEGGLLQERSQKSVTMYYTALATGLATGLLALGAIIAFIALLWRHLRTRAKAAATIAEQGERWRTTISSIGDAVITTDMRGLVTNLNAVAETLTGWKNNEAFGKPLASVFRIVNEETRQTVANPVDKVHAEGVVVGLANHTVLIAKDGREHPIDDSAAPIRCKDGEVVGCVLVFRDVGERRSAEQALRESEGKLRAIFDGTSEYIGLLTPQGVLLEANRASLTFGETKREDVIGRPFWETVWFRHTAGAPEAVRQAIARAAAGELVRYETTINAPTGETRWFQISFCPISDDRGDVILIVPEGTDITELKQAEDSLRQSEQRMRFIMDAMPQKIFTAAPSGDVDYFNPIWTEYTGLSFEQIRDWGWTQFVHPDDLAENVRAWRQSLKTGETFSFEQRFRRADGEFRWHISRAKPLQDAEGNILMWVGSNTDIHEQKETANELRAVAAQLSEADRRKNEFLAMLAHELRNPLAPIRNALQIMRIPDGNGERVKSASDMMDRQLRQLVRLVDDLLDVSRITQGKIELRRERVELASIIEQAVETSRPAIDSAKHQLTVSLPPQPVHMNGDVVRLTQVFSNLLNNAAKFTEPRGQIRLTVEQLGQQVQVSVKDSGVGIRPEALSNIFELFTQADRSLERSQGGLGIGLTLVKRLVEMHGGSVTAQSDGPGRGTEFIVRLPIVVDAQQPADSVPANNKPTQALTKRILVVDDNYDSATSLAMLLKISGNDTHTAHDGLEAIAAAASFRPDIILLDIGLPKLNGYEVARKIREQPWGKSLILVALTGWGQEEDRQKSKDAGFNTHLVKPVEFAALINLLSALQPTPV